MEPELLGKMPGTGERNIQDEPATSCTIRELESAQHTHAHTHTIMQACWSISK